MEDSLKTEIIIKSVTKIAQQDGIPVFVVKKGDPDSGIILIKIDLLNGKGQLIRRNYSYSLKKNKSVIEHIKLHKEIELEYPKLQKLIEKEIKIDTDAWVVEIEDKQGRNFFEKIYFLLLYRLYLKTFLCLCWRVISFCIQ